MRKYLFNRSLLAALASGWGTLQSTRKGPKDWRLILSWIVWALTLAIAIGTVVQESKADD